MAPYTNSMHWSGVGGYTCTERIGVGGMAEIYRARPGGAGGLEREVVVKRMLPDLARDQALVQLFLDEARLGASLRHDNVAAVLDFGEDHGDYYIVLEYVDGVSLGLLLERALEQGLQVPALIGAYVALEICRGLEHAHTRKAQDGRPLSIVHRDINPQNVLLSFNGEVKLTDFGIASSAGRTAATLLPRFNGQAGYQSPEQVLGAIPDARSDLFAVGVVLYKMLTGAKPYIGGAPDYLDPRKLNASVDRRLSRILRQALAPIPDQRYRSAAAMAADLEAVLHRTGEVYASEALARLMRTCFPRRPTSLGAADAHEAQRVGGLAGLDHPDQDGVREAQGQ